MYRARRRRRVVAAAVSVATALLVVLSCLVAGLVGMVDATEAKDNAALLGKAKTSVAINDQQQRVRRRRRQLQSSDAGVLIHLKEDCETCIGVSANSDTVQTVGVTVETGANLIKVACNDTSFDVEKLWIFSDGGNWCLRNDDELCIFYDPDQTSAADMLTIQDKQVNQRHFFFHETSGEITQFSSPDQCVVAGTGNSIELRSCSSFGDGEKQWDMPTSDSYQCVAETSSPTASPSSAPSGSPVSSTNAPSFSPSSAPTTPVPSNRPSALLSDTPSVSPTETATASPTVSPTSSSPSAAPVSLTREPSPNPSAAPTILLVVPTNRPSVLLSESPSLSPIETAPTASPGTSKPSVSPVEPPTLLTDSVAEEEYNDGITAEVGDKVIPTNNTASSPTRKPTLSPKEKKALRKKAEKEKKQRQKQEKQQQQITTSPPTRKPTLSPKQKKALRKKQAKEKKQQQKQKQQIENITSPPTRQPTLSPKEKRKKQARERRKKQQQKQGDVPNSTAIDATAQPSGIPSDMPSRVPSLSPSAAPSVDDGVSTTQVDYSLSVRYDANVTEDDVLSIVQLTTYTLLQESVRDRSTDLYRLAEQDGLEDVRVTSSNLVGGSNTTEADGCQPPPKNVTTRTKCNVLEVTVKAKHDDTASGGEVRHALLALTLDLVERLQLQFVQAFNLGARIVSYNNRMVISGVADNEPPRPEAIVTYEEALRALLRSEKVREEAGGLDVIHLEVTGATVQAGLGIPSTTTAATEGNGTAASTDIDTKTDTDNIFHKESDRNDGSVVSETQLKLGSRRNLQAARPSVTFETLILGEYASPMGVDADLNTIIASNADTVQAELKRSGAEYFENIDSAYAATDSPTAGPTKAPSPDTPSIAGETDPVESKAGLSTGAIVGIAVSAFVVLLSAVGFFIFMRNRQSKGKKMLSNEEFDALQRQKRNDLALNALDGDAHESFRGGRSRRKVVPEDAFSEGSGANDSYYEKNLEQGWNEVEDPRGAKARTDLGDRWAAFEQDETLEEQKTEATSNALLMGLKQAIRRTWGGSGDDQQSASSGSDYFAGPAGMEEEKEEDEDFLRKLQTLYVQGKISKGEFVTLKEAHLRKQQMQEDDEAREEAEVFNAPDEESSIFSSNPEIERMYRAGEISEEEYQQMMATHDRLKKAQSGDGQGSAIVENDHGAAAVRDDESLFSSNPEAERLYNEGTISKQEYDQIRDTHQRLRRSQVGIEALDASLLDDMSGDEEDVFPNTLGNHDADSPRQADVPEDDETLFSNNAEMDQLYREGKITAAEWRQMKTTHTRLRQEQKRVSISDEDVDVYDDQGNEDYTDDAYYTDDEEGDWDDDRRLSGAEEEQDAFAEEERRRAEEEEAVRLRVKEQFRRAEEEAAAQKARMQDEWRRDEEAYTDDDDREDDHDEYAEDDEEYDDFNEDQSLFTTSHEIERMYKSGQISRKEYEQIQASHGRLKEIQEDDVYSDEDRGGKFHEDQSVSTNVTTSHEINKLYSDGAISEAEMRQMLEQHSRLKRAQEGTNDPDTHQDTNDDQSVLTTSNEIQRLYEDGAITEAEMKEMQLNHNRLRKSQKLEEIERMYRDGEVDEDDYHLLLDSYERLQEEKSSPKAGEEVEMEDMKPAASSSVPELTPDEVSVYSTNSEVEQLYKDGMLDESEYRQMRETHSRLRKLQKGEMSYRAADKAPALW